ncbi:hypothetical protein EAI_03502 [Harpegnathos saltator]|uniref:Uncharacterized protein n=1 Tax=Harpegnathos saltator TaxID=610380 RepID=E2BGP0_HARSA|nr:hypothetical protein EAI_03502 [Harpegnathos saltator]
MCGGGRTGGSAQAGGPQQTSSGRRGRGGKDLTAARRTQQPPEPQVEAKAAADTPPSERDWTAVTKKGKKKKKKKKKLLVETPTAGAGPGGGVSSGAATTERTRPRLRRGRGEEGSRILVQDVSRAAQAPSKAARTSTSKAAQASTVKAIGSTNKAAQASTSRVTKGTGTEGEGTINITSGRKRARAGTSSGSSVVEMSSLIAVPKKRGRPVTTGEGVGIKERKEEELKRRKEAELQRLEREAGDPFGKGLFRSLEDTRPAKDVFRDPSCKELLREAGAPELALEMGRALDAVRIVARRSKILKGTIVALLNRAVATSEAVLAILIARTAVQDGREEEVSAWRKKMENLREDNRRLRVETRRLAENLRVVKGQGLSSPPDPLAFPPLLSDSRRRKTYAEASGGTTSTEEELLYARTLARRRRKKRRTRKQSSASSSKGKEETGGRVSSEEVPSFNDNLPEEVPLVWRPEGVKKALDAEMATGGRWSRVPEGVGALTLAPVSEGKEGASPERTRAPPLPAESRRTTEKGKGKKERTKRKKERKMEKDRRRKEEQELVLKGGRTGLVSGSQTGRGKAQGKENGSGMGIPAKDLKEWGRDPLEKGLWKALNSGGGQ